MSPAPRRRGRPKALGTGDVIADRCSYFAKSYPRGREAECAALEAKDEAAFDKSGCDCTKHHADPACVAENGIGSEKQQQDCLLHYAAIAHSAIRNGLVYGRVCASSDMIGTFAGAYYRAGDGPKGLEAGLSALESLSPTGYAATQRQQQLTGGLATSVAGAHALNQIFNSCYYMYQTTQGAGSFCDTIPDYPYQDVDVAFGQGGDVLKACQWQPKTKLRPPVKKPVVEKPQEPQKPAPVVTDQNGAPCTKPDDGAGWTFNPTINPTKPGNIVFDMMNDPNWGWRNLTDDQRTRLATQAAAEAATPRTGPIR